MASRSAFRIAAVVLLVIGALGGLGIAGSSLAALLGPGASILPTDGLLIVGGLAGAYGFGSLVAAVGVWRRAPWALTAVLASQGLLALDLTAIAVGGVVDGALLAVLAITYGAIVCAVIADRRDGVTWRNPAATGPLARRDFLVPLVAGLAVGGALIVARGAISGGLPYLMITPLRLLFDTWLIAPVIVASGWALARSGGSRTLARALVWTGLIWCGLVVGVFLVGYATCAFCLA